MSSSITLPNSSYNRLEAIHFRGKVVSDNIEIEGQPGSNLIINKEGNKIEASSILTTDVDNKNINITGDLKIEGALIDPLNSQGNIGDTLTSNGIGEWYWQPPAGKSTILGNNYDFVFKDGSDGNTLVTNSAPENITPIKIVPNSVSSEQSIMNIDVDNKRVGINTDTPENTLSIDGKLMLVDSATNSINIGKDNGKIGQQGNNCIAIGYGAGEEEQKLESIAIGYYAAWNNQGEGSVAIGTEAGGENQSNSSFAMGYQAGQVSQGIETIAIGIQAGQNSQSNFALAIGAQAGQNSQGVESFAMGYYAGNDRQGNSSMAIGVQAGETTQKDYAIAIGVRAGRTNQGENSIAIGRSAGESNQVDNSIILNGSGSSLDASDSGFFVNPIRNLNSNPTLKYNTTTKEITYNGSSRRYKDNIKPINEDTEFINTEKIYNLEAKTYIYKSSGVKEMGFIAEEVETELPSVVFKKDGEAEAIDYERLVVPIIEEMKKLKTEISSLKNRIEILESN